MRICFGASHTVPHVDRMSDSVSQSVKEGIDYGFKETEPITQGQPCVRSSQ